MPNLTIKKVERFLVSDGTEFETIGEADAHCRRVEDVAELVEQIRTSSVGDIIHPDDREDVARWILDHFDRKGSIALTGDPHG